MSRKYLGKITDLVERSISEVNRNLGGNEQYREGQLQALHSVRRFIELLDNEEDKLYKEGNYDISTEEIYKD